MALILALLMQAAPAEKARVEVIDGPPSCRECVIERYRIATITDDSLAGPVGPFATVVVTRGGGFLLTRRGQSTPFFADRRGIVTRAVGKAGAGPGEYRQPWLAIESSTGFIVPDVGLGRINDLDANLQFRKSYAFRAIGLVNYPVPVGNVLIVNAEFPTADAMGHPLHIVSANGQVVRSFGGGASTDGIALHRALTAGPNGSFFAAHRTRYRIEQWDTTGRLLTAFERRVPWFAAEGGVERRSLRQIYRDDEGLIWVQVTVRDATPETMIEVIDPVRKQVVATARIEGWAADPAAGGFFMKRYVELPTGEPRLEVWGFRLRR